MNQFLKYMKPYGGFMLVIIVLLTAEAYFALVLPSYMADIVNDGVLTGRLSVIWRNGLIMLGLTFLSMLIALVVGFFTAKTATGVANDLREAVYEKVLRFSSAEVSKFNTSSLITRTTNDIVQVQNTLMMAIRQFIYAPVIAVGGIIRALERSTDMAWTVVIPTAIMMAAIGILCVVALPKYKKWQDLIDRINLVSRENLSGILVVRAFSTQGFEKKRFNEANTDLATTERFVNQAFSFLTPVIMLVMNLTTALIVWVGAHQASAFRADIGDIFAFLQYGMLIIFSFLMISMMFILVPRAIVSMKRIEEVLDTEGSIKPAENPLPFPDNFKGVVEFKDVTFRYPDATENDDNVLEGISFTAQPGQTTAIIGATGVGKSTILKLLLRFFDVTSGGIYIDGIDIRDAHKEELHHKIGYVAQKASLFSGTIMSNLLYADKDATEAQVKKAVEISQSAEFIAGKPEGYEANVAQGGANFSGGQRQRLSIARALVKDAPINLFDDSFSALDVKTDALLRAALKKESPNKTTIVIAQRISSIMDADLILVLDGGKIAGSGKHKELMKTCDVYREIAESQLSEEEVEKS
ncbi:MAG: ABC transporter ATP-binding protein/permease [Defluviitaleaceae bacterium]|nr:ABC transporter ATP-binding protein/permease [Defluviitaleaceae bacterium]MCL2263243.1 ABC transporter ATP-binding protein/permease [Defluviitaleaceae bacterium]